MTLSEIESAIQLSWSIDTTYCVDDYASRHPAWGNCAVTALLLQKLLGGELMRGWAIEPGQLGTAHYWNRVNGLDLDLTWRQFAHGTILTNTATADYHILVENEWMRERYENFVAAFCYRVQQRSGVPGQSRDAPLPLMVRAEGWIGKPLAVLRRLRSVVQATG
jgi:hypothetical protein